jgi:hypothetical protein
MYFIEYYRPSAVDPNKAVPATGDRSVVIIDGRERRESWHQYAHEMATQYGRTSYTHYRIMRGTNLLRGMRSLSGVLPLVREDTINE